MPLAHRSRAPEIMDGEAFTPSELRGNLADIGLYNRFLGGAAAVTGALRPLLAPLPPGSRAAVLDVGTGGADVACAVARSLRRLGLRPLVVASDVNERMIEAARALDGRRAAAKLCLSDGRALPHGDAAFDAACCSLLLHHLDEPSIERLLAEMKRVTRLGFVVADLRRSAPALASVWALTRLTTRNRLTLYDAPLSVRRALTVAELRRVALRAGLRERRPAGGAGGSRDEGFETRRSGVARVVLSYRHARRDA